VPQAEHPADTLRPPPLAGHPAPVHTQGHSANTIPPSGSGPQRRWQRLRQRRHPPGSRHAAAPDTRPSAADTRPEWPPGWCPQKRSTTKGPVSVIGDQVPVSVARRHCPGRRARVPQLPDTARKRTQLRTQQSTTWPSSDSLVSTSRAADGQSADRSGSLQLPLRFLKAGPAGGRP
jgi:hypothetical protein